MLGEIRKCLLSRDGTGPVRMIVGETPYREIQDVPKEPSFGKQCSGASSCDSAPSGNPGESVTEKRPPSKGASYDRAGGPSGQPTEQVAESQYSTESSEK